MNIIQNASELPDAPRRVCLAIGVFDGVHLGHQQVIRQTTGDASHEEASSVVVTFDRHPNTIVAPHAVPPAVYSLDQKLQAIESLGVDTTVMVPFDESFSRLTAEEFVDQLIRGFGSIRSICVGRKFTFGHRRGGNVELLQKIGQSHNFKVHGLAAVALDGQVVSSTRIRECIQAGDLDSASQMLGRDYKLSGKVIRGDGIGRKLGFPTANIDVTGLLTPPKGVYAVHLFRDRTVLRGVANIGVRPTVSADKPALSVEVHLLDFAKDLYGETLDLQFLTFVRPEMKFPSVERLQKQIELDIETAKQKF
jgi:riboflavin kinase/FMN adenylyltransferase